MSRLLFLIPLLWISLSSADVATQVTIDKPFARSAMQHQRNSAVFMQIRNPGAAATIINATSAASDVVELHTHVNDQGVMRMRRIPEITLPAGARVELKPGGLHVMLIGLRRDLKVGEAVDVTLEFNDGSRKSVTAPVHKVMRKHGQKMGHGKMMQH